MSHDYDARAIQAHEQARGKLSIQSKLPVTNADELSLAYTPGVAAVCKDIAQNIERAKVLTSAKRTVAVVTDGSAVLGLGNIGPDAALPVMEGKAVLFKEFADIDAFPIALDTQDVHEIVETVSRIAPSFGGINLEDISAPRCFEVEALLKERLDIPVFHDDQHGTAIVVLAALINALKVSGKQKDTIKIVVVGSGAAGVAIVELLTVAGFPRCTIVDSKGIVSNCRVDLTHTQHRMLHCCAVAEVCGDLGDALDGADVLIGVSTGNIVTRELFARMNPEPIVFAMANPTPEIAPELAHELGASIVATGRSDYPNQINNVLAFPGVFKGVFDAGATNVTMTMKRAAAEALAALVKHPTKDNIIPGPFDAGVADAVAAAVARSAQQ